MRNATKDEIKFWEAAYVASLAGGNCTPSAGNSLNKTARSQADHALRHRKQRFPEAHQTPTFETKKDGAYR